MALLIVWLLIASEVSASVDDCACACLEGHPTTVCKSVAAAQANPNLCQLQTNCPFDKPSTDSPEEPVWLDAPHADAINCRAVRIWDKREQDYAGVKVCDVVSAK